jgi:hypothetical protein
MNVHTCVAHPSATNPMPLRLRVLAVMAMLATISTKAVAQRAGSARGPTRAIVDSLRQLDIARTVRSMGEPRLDQQSSGGAGTVMRFLWMRAFHPAVAVRVVNARGRCRVVTTVLELDAAEYGPPDREGIQALTRMRPGAIQRRDSTDVPSARCASLNRTLVPVLRTRQSTHLDGVDGSQWIFEQRDARGYASASRWSPDQVTDGSLRRAGISFLQLGSALPAAHEIY